MPNLRASGDGRKAGAAEATRKYGATADLARELRVQRRLLLKMQAQIDKAAATATQNKLADVLQQPARHSSHQVDRGQGLDDEARAARRQKIAETISRQRTKEFNERKQQRRNKNNRKIAAATIAATALRERQQARAVKTPPAFRSLKKAASLRKLREAQSDRDRARIRRQVLSQSYLRRSSSTGKIRQASHAGIWQPGNPGSNTMIGRGMNNKSGSSTAGLANGGLEPAVGHALTQYSYLINNRVPGTTFGSAKYMGMPGSYAADEEDVGGPAFDEQPSMSARMVPFPAQAQGRSQGSASGRGRRRRPTEHPRDYELEQLRLRQKKRMHPLLFPDVAGWNATVKEKPLLKRDLSNWNELRYETWDRQAAGGGGGDKGRRKNDTHVLQDLLTTTGLNYGEKLMNAAYETSDREDLIKTTRFTIASTF